MMGAEAEAEVPKPVEVACLLRASSRCLRSRPPRPFLCCRCLLVIRVGQMNSARLRLAAVAAAAVSLAAARLVELRNDVPRRDTAGQSIDCHSGMSESHGGTPAALDE